MNDELQLLRCGCGGEPMKIVKLYMSDWKYYSIVCKKCGIQTKEYFDPSKTINAWNKAMGMGEQTVKVINSHPYRICGTCTNCGESVYDKDSYCSHCGSKLDWSNNE